MQVTLTHTFGSVAKFPYCHAQTQFTSLSKSSVMEKLLSSYGTIIEDFPYCHKPTEFPLTNTGLVMCGGERT